MLEFLQVLATFLVAVTMSLALAHAAELPGKLRLDKETYLAVQRIYYPGFTVGALAEPAAIVATAVLLFVSRVHPDVWWILGALVLLVTMHAVYWVVTHPVNSFWLRDQQLTSAGAGFFSFGVRRSSAAAPPRGDEWTSLRDRWEYSHVARAALAMLSLVLLLIAVAT